MHVSFILSKDTGEIRTIYVWSDNELIKELFKSFLNNYQKEEIKLRKESYFIFKSVDLLCYHVHKTSLKRGKSYIKSPE